MSDTFVEYSGRASPVWGGNPLVYRHGNPNPLGNRGSYQLLQGLPEHLIQGECIT